MSKEVLLQEKGFRTSILHPAKGAAVSNSRGRDSQLIPREGLGFLFCPKQSRVPDLDRDNDLSKPNLRGHCIFSSCRKETVRVYTPSEMGGGILHQVKDEGGARPTVLTRPAVLLWG